MEVVFDLRVYRPEIGGDAAGDDCALGLCAVGCDEYGGIVGAGVSEKVVFELLCEFGFRLVSDKIIIFSNDFQGRKSILETL